MLTTLTRFFNIFVFTRECKSLAVQIVKRLDPESIIFSGLLSLKKCIRIPFGHLLKDLRIISNKSLKELILIDNEAFSFCYQIDNGIPLMSWEGDETDSELLYLAGYLIKMHECEDVRIINRNHFKLRELASLSKQELTQMF